MYFSDRGFDQRRILKSETAVFFLQFLESLKLGYTGSIHKELERSG
jgi:hypothetical protein